MLQAVIQGSGEYVMALRDGRLLAERLVPAIMPLPRPTLPPCHTSIITGGTKGLGLAYAKHAIKKGMKCAVLASRSPQLDVAELAALAEGSGTRAAFTVRCDAGNPGELARVLDWAREHLPVVNSIVHAAGALGQVLLCQPIPVLQSYPNSQA